MKPQLNIKSIWYEKDYVTLTFQPHGMKMRGVSSAYMNMGGDFVVTIQFDAETVKQSRKRKRESVKLVNTMIDVMSAKIPKGGLR